MSSIEEGQGVAVVKACIDLGNPKLEPSIHLIFHNADRDRAPDGSHMFAQCDKELSLLWLRQDEDGLLSMEDVQSLLPEAGHASQGSQVFSSGVPCSGLRPTEPRAEGSWP